MRRWSSSVLLAFIAGFITAVVAVSFQTNSHASQSQSTDAQASSRGQRGDENGPQGWAGTAPSPEPPLEPKAPASVKEREVWIPPLPSMAAVAPPAGWVTSGPDVPPMPLTLLRLPRTNITRAKFPAIDFHLHGRGLTTPAAYARFVRLLDSIGVGVVSRAFPVPPFKLTMARRHRAVGNVPGSWSRAPAVARIHHQVPGSRPAGNRWQSGPRGRRVLDAPLEGAGALRRVLLPSRANSDGGGIARARPLEHFGAGRS